MVSDGLYNRALVLHDIQYDFVIQREEKGENAHIPKDHHLLPPPEMAEQVQVLRDESRTMSELIKEAIRNSRKERKWLWTIRYERLRARYAEQED